MSTTAAAAAAVGQTSKYANVCWQNLMRILLANPITRAQLEIEYKYRAPKSMEDAWLSGKDTFKRVGNLTCSVRLDKLYFINDFPEDVEPQQTTEVLSVQEELARLHRTINGDAPLPARMVASVH